MRSSHERYSQPERWVAEGGAALGRGIAWAGFWIGAAIIVSAIIQ